MTPPRRRLSLLLAVPALLCAFAGAATTTATAQRPARSLTALAALAERQGLRTGIAVRELRTGRVSFRHRSAEAFLPSTPMN